MPSKEKKEIVENGVFGTIVSLAAGGLPAAVVTGITSLLIGRAEEKKDERLREQQRERDRQYKESREEALRKIREVPVSSNTTEEQFRERQQSTYINKDLVQYYKDKEIVDDAFKNCMRIKNIRIECDYDRNNHKVNNVISVLPRINPYVKVMFSHPYKCDETMINPQVIYGNGIILETDEFSRRLSDDRNNPNFEAFSMDRMFYEGIGKYIGWRTTKKEGRCSSYKGKRFKHMYTIDGGENFILCWEKEWTENI